MRSITAWTASQTMCAALCVAGSLSVAQPARAVEYGIGDYLLGFTVPMSAYTPPPGVYFSDTFYLYQGSASANINFPIGRITAAGLTYNFVVDAAAVAHGSLTPKSSVRRLDSPQWFLSSAREPRRVFHSSVRWAQTAPSAGPQASKLWAIVPSAPASAGRRASTTGT